MPCTKNKTGLFSEQKETESAGSSPSASHLLYATEEAIQKITPDMDDERRHTGLRLPWGRDLSRKEAALRQMCFLPSAGAVPAEGGLSNRRERRDPAELRADPYFNSGTSPLKGLVIPVLRKRISLSSPENLIICRLWVQVPSPAPRKPSPYGDFREGFFVWGSTVSPVRIFPAAEKYFQNPSK